MSYLLDPSTVQYQLRSDAHFSACVSNPMFLHASDGCFAAAGELAHQILCKSLPVALCWNPKHMMLAYSGRESGLYAYVNVFAP